MKFFGNFVIGSSACIATAAPSLEGRSSKKYFEFVGLGKDNPIGETTGGKGGPTTTITDAAALATAVAVRETPSSL